METLATETPPPPAAAPVCAPRRPRAKRLSPPAIQQSNRPSIHPPLRILTGDALTHLRALPSESVQCCVSSPPYWGLRDYGVAGQLGLERTPEEFVAKLVAIYEEVRRVLRHDGTCWVNLGDSYASAPAGCDGVSKSSGLNGAKGETKYRETLKQSVGGKRSTLAPGLKPKDLVGIPWRVAFALQAAGWYLRADIIWHKPNPMPESVTDRPTKAHEYLFLLTKSQRYYYDAAAVREPMTRGDSGSSFCEGKTELHQLGRASKAARKHRKPAGWDTSKGEGAHGTIHRKGRTPSGEYYEVVETMRNKRSVWTVPTFSFAEAHFATYPPALIKPCILAGSRPGEVILDPFAGSGTTGAVALELGRAALLIELNPAYVRLIERRCQITPGLAL
jgi:DNA modification methylase